MKHTTKHGESSGSARGDPRIVFPGESEMAHRCRAFDWTATPLGAIDGWPSSLRTTVAMLVTARHPMILFWGAEHVQLYNDAYIPALGGTAHHPTVLGMRAADRWQGAAWQIVGPELDHVVATGGAIWHEDQYVALPRHGRVEDTYWSYGFNPVYDDAGHVAGVLAITQETTERVLADRRRQALVTELEATNAQFQDNAAEVEAANEELQTIAAALEARTDEAERAVAALAESEARNRLAVDAAQLGTWTWDMVTDAATFDARVRELFAFPDDEPQPRVDILATRVHADDRERVGAALAGAADPAGNGRYAAEYRVVRPDGTERWALASGLMRFEGEGAARRPVSLIGTVLDVTERKRAETALAASDARYRALLESLDTGFCVIEVLFDDAGRAVDYRYLETNATFERQSGLVGAVGRRVREFAPELESQWFETFGRVAATGEPVRTQEHAADLGRWFEVFAYRVDAPELHRVAVLFTDVSADRAAEAERERLLRSLAVERSRLNDVIRQAPAFMVVLRGPEHVLELANDAYQQLIGHRDVVGLPLFVAVPEARGQGFEEVLDRVLATGEPFVGRGVSVRLQRAPGAPLEERFIDIAYVPLSEADGSRSGIVVLGTDVTEQLRARHEVERSLGESERARADAEAARAEAERANRAKDEFLSTMSHELRTPLNAIGGYAELMELGIRGPVSEQQRIDLGRIQQSQRHLLGLVNEVLDLAKVDAGALRIERASVRAGDTVDAALALVRPQATAKMLVVSETCGGAADRPYLGDEPRVRQVLLNLLSNAIKFTRPGGQITVECVLSGTPPADAALRADLPYVGLRVADTGTGIHADQLQRIFEPFTQAEGGATPYTRTTEGTGLGLTISRRLARLMGGDLTVESREGAGSTFTLWIPAVEQRTTTHAAATPPNDGRRSTDRPAATSPSSSSPSSSSSSSSASSSASSTRPTEPPTGGESDAAATLAIAAASGEAPGLARIGEALVAEVAPALRAWVARLRTDPGIPDASTHTDAELENHAATFATDVALALRALETTDGEPAVLMRDGTAILGVIAERHGAQRARLGWTADAVAREFTLLAEVLDTAVQRAAPSDAHAALERARTVVAQLVAQAARVSLGGYRLAATPAQWGR